MPGAVLSTRDMIGRLVAFDTTSRESNLALIDFVRGYLAGWGVGSELVYDRERRKANLYATIGPAEKSGILLSGHTDVVPVDGQVWDGDPFAVAEKDGRLYGRGTADMKSFIAVALALVPEFLARPLKTPVHFAFTYDEEAGCAGVRELIAALKERPVRPGACIVGEPTSMRPVIAHKGKHSQRCRVRGLETHSALAHEGVNAVEAAAEIVAYLKSMARRKRDRGPFDPAFAPPYTTVHTGVIRGGTALNIVPRECSFDFEVRNIPADDAALLIDEVKRFAAAAVVPEMQKVSAAAGVAFEKIGGVDGLDTPPDHPLVQLVRSLTGANAVDKASFCSEAGLYHHDAEIPTVLCGPGSIEVAHKPNEYIDLDQVRRCETFLRRLADHLAQNA
ncbi:MAG TPA: acetylornithine deacetylase [Stellaceae bacterium]|nr:acetylornithine deacetylase [Stellaceae bacterium]